VTQHAKNGLTIGRRGVDVLLHGGVERRLRCRMSGLRLQPWGGGSCHEQYCHNRNEQSHACPPENAL
jgi:hypothetical protein